MNNTVNREPIESPADDLLREGILSAPQILVNAWKVLTTHLALLACSHAVITRMAEVERTRTAQHRELMAALEKVAAALEGRQ